ncbi:MAG: hypothetical protein M9933_05285 [Chitinophagaceae bacterium]|nr:hypothetical protein [Chitinophagaceae bacterium]
MKTSFAIGIMLFFMASCGKDTFSDKPMLKLKSVSPGQNIPGDGDLVFTIEYTDAQGDLAGVPIAIEKNSSLSPCDNPGNDPSFFEDRLYNMPEDLPATANQKGEIVITLNSSQYAGTKRCNENQESEEAIFKFWVTDLAGNESDTLVVGPITILKP